MAKKHFVLWIFLLCAIISFDSLAQTTGDYRTNGVGTNWGVAANWDRWSGVAWVPGVSYPGQAAALPATTVTIQSGHAMTVNLTPANAINALTFAINATNSSVTMATGFTLTITNAVTFNIPSADNRSQTLAVSDGNVICGSISMSNTPSNLRTNSVTVASGGALTVNGAIAAGGAANEDLINLAGTGTLNIVGPFANGTGGLTLSATSTVRWFGDDTNFRSDVNYGNLTIEIPVGALASRTKTLLNNLTVQGVFIAQSLHALNTVSLDPVANNFTVSGATNLNARGIFTDSNAGGINTFTGTVTLAAASTFSTTTVTALANLLFGNGISNAGTFTAGGATFQTTASQSVGGASAMSFANPVSVAVDITLAGAGTLTFANSVTLSGATTDVTNNKSNTVTFSNAGAAMLTGTAGASWIQGAGSTLAYGASTITTITLDASTNSNIVNYTAAAQTVYPVSYSILGLSGSGTKTITGVTSISSDFNISGTASATAPAAMTIGNLNLTAGTFVGGAFTHTITGNWVRNGGTFTNTGSTIRFNGAAPNIGGTVSTTFNNLTIASLGTTTLSFATAVAGIFEINNGTAVNLGGLTTHTANRLTFGGRGESAGTWGGTGSGATNITSAYFSAASGRITVAVTGSASLHYQETFAGETDGSTSNTLPPWSVTQFPSSGTFEKQTPAIFFGADGFEINNTGATEGVWETADLDFSSATYPEVYLSVDVFVTSTSVSDYVDVAYVWDAEGPGSENLIQTITTTTGSPSITLPTAGHSKIRMVIRAKENTAGNIFIFFPREFDLANVNILGIRNLYSRTSTNWHTAGTWSTVGIGGVSCACTPSAFGSDRVFVGGGNLVTLDNNGFVASLTVNGTADAGGAGTLTFGGNFGLSPMLVNSTITVNNGGQISAAGFASSAFTFSVDNAQSIVNNGTISVGDINVTGSTFYAPTISLSGSGSTTLTDALTVTGSNFGNNNATFTNSGTGAFTVTGTTTLTDGTYTDTDNTSITTFIGNVAPSGNSIFTSTAVTTTGNLVFRGGITHTGTTFSAGGATFNTNNQTLSGTLSFANIVTVNTPTLITNNGTVTMSNTGTGILAGTGTWGQGATGVLNFAGASMTVATLNASTTGNTVDYNSTVAQAIKTPSASYDILTLDNSFASIPSFTVSGNITVISTLNFNNGIVNLGGNTFTLGSSGVASDMNRTASTTTKWMYGGSFTRFWLNATAVAPGGGNLYGLFPLGSSTANSYRPFLVNSTANPTATGSFTATHTDVAGSTDLSPAFSDAGTNIVRKNNSQFVTSVSGVTGGTYMIGATMTGLAAGTLSDIRLATSTGATTVTTVGTHFGATGTAQNPTAYRQSLTIAQTVGDFRISTANSTNTPLPIELVSFKGEVINDAVQLSWETASELNNDFFTVERSASGEDFSSVGQVNGGGTTNHGNLYSLVDHNPIHGTSYYRLKQTDFDGTFTYSKIIDVNYEGTGALIMEVYPNPTKGDQLNIRISGLKNVESVPVVLYDQLGRESMKLMLTVDENSGTAYKSFALDGGLPQGIYLLKAGPSLMLIKRFVVTSK